MQDFRLPMANHAANAFSSCPIHSTRICTKEDAYAYQRELHPRIQPGGLDVIRAGAVLYSNRRPMHITVNTPACGNAFYDAPYDSISEEAGCALASGVLTLPSGFAFAFEDRYEPAADGFVLRRRVTVQNAGGDLGFASRFSLFMTASDSPADFEGFAPGSWYIHNEFAPQNYMGRDLDCEYFWKYETRYALPLFAMRHEATGETIALSRWAADITLRDLNAVMSENTLDPKFTIGSIGMSRPTAQTLNYMYYGFVIRRDHPATLQGLSIDYVYPGAEGQCATVNHYSGLDFRNKPMSFQYVNHPVETGFAQTYAVGMNFGCYGTYHDMMKATWRSAYDRLRDDLFPVYNTQHFHNCMRIFSHYTRQYEDAWGLPFAAQLPEMIPNSISFQFGFVGQQPGIGYMLLRYGLLEGDAEALEKGYGILDFWVRAADRDTGLPPMCYNPNLRGFEPYPHYIRMLADGLEAIQEAWRLLHQRDVEKPEYLRFCRKAADWLIAHQNVDGSFYRAYEADGAIRMPSKSNTPSVIRFLEQMHLITGEATYLHSAQLAGEWTLREALPRLEFRGGTCDNNDIQDKEAGIYGIWGFLALYDLTKEARWLDAACIAADYTETWTYAWNYPIATPWPHHPFNKQGISGQSIITIGSGADVYMAACVYTYFRLYVLTKDPHYLDFAQFIDCNTRQANDMDGGCGYILPGLCHESGGFALQQMGSHYHWLPWCTFVQAEPAARMLDSFGTYEVARAREMPMADLEVRNDIYRDYV